VCLHGTLRPSVLAREGVEAVAICLLFSFANPTHEQRLQDLVAAHLPGVFVTTSYDVLPQIREYERVSTTAINAYVSPPLASYLGELARAWQEGDERDTVIVTPATSTRARPRRWRSSSWTLTGPTWPLPGPSSA
jgi:N-methylhydantoinase A/oxoprolinase/acetone carboxylase beta subunit